MKTYFYKAEIWDSNKIQHKVEETALTKVLPTLYYLYNRRLELQTYFPS